MTTKTYGLVGQPNITLTMITTKEEDARTAVNDSGEKLPDDVINKRMLSFARHRLARHITGGDKEESAELPGIFPIN